MKMRRVVVTGMGIVSPLALESIMSGPIFWLEKTVPGASTNLR